MLTILDPRHSVQNSAGSDPFSPSFALCIQTVVDSNQSTWYISVMLCHNILVFLADAKLLKDILDTHTSPFSNNAKQPHANVADLVVAVQKVDV